MVGLVAGHWNPLAIGPGDVVQLPSPVKWTIDIAGLFTGPDLKHECLYGTPRDAVIVQPVFFGESRARIQSLEQAAQKKYGVPADRVIEVQTHLRSPLSVAMPTALKARPAGPRIIELTWSDRSNNEGAFAISNGDTVRQVARNSRFYRWSVKPGTYMCFKVKALRGQVESRWYPDHSPWYVCVKTPMR